MFRRNVYWPNNPSSLAPYSVPRLACNSNGATTPIAENIFQSGIDKDYCRSATTEFGNQWTDNVFAAGTPCGATASLPWGYVLDSGKLTATKEAAAALRTLFALARAKGATPATIAKALRTQKVVAPARRGWTAALVRRALTEPRYLGRMYGPVGWHPAIVSQAAWKKAQAAVAR